MMSTYLCISVRLLDEAYHGRADRGEPEWPPAPMRLLQALVAAAGRRQRDGALTERDVAALSWLERLAPPTIVAPTTWQGAKHRLYVPDNIADRVAGAWSRGNEATIADYRTEKDVHVVWIEREADEPLPPIHFLWALPDDASAGDSAPFIDALQPIARSVTHLGWGVDMAAAQVRVIESAEAEALTGHRWKPTPRGGVARRVPIAGSVEALLRKHQGFLARFPTPDTFTVVPPFTTFDVAHYDSPTAGDKRMRSSRCPFAAFSVLNTQGDGYRPFDTVRNGSRLAGMLRHATAEAANLSWGDADLVNRFVLGHGEARGEAHSNVGLARFAFLPLPSLERRGKDNRRTVSAVRRVLIADLSGTGGNPITWAQRALPGSELVAEGKGEVEATLGSLPSTDANVKPYVEASTTWATVTPMLLPGFDDPRHLRRRIERDAATLSAEEKLRLLGQLDERIDGLIRKSIVQAGLSETLAQHAIIDWAKSGFLPGVDLADRYFVPKVHAGAPRWHVRITWRDAAGAKVPMAGPICLGRGKFYGLGLFVGLDAISAER